jgi:16S rRNA (cytidine1402-2'-O)-methyltransferase
MSILILFHGQNIMHKGTLYLIPSPIADTPLSDVIPSRNLEIIRSLGIFIVEEIRTARRFLIKAGMPSVDDITFVIFNEHSNEADFEECLRQLETGRPVGLLSEAGLPCVADPGSKIVLHAHSAGIHVVPLSGPSSIFLALMSSGFNGQNFVFHGYLPAEKELRKRRIRELDAVCRQTRQTQIFIEAPYRNQQLFDAILNSCHSDTWLCLASEVTSSQETILTRSIHEWKKHKPDINKRSTIFLIHHP